MCSQHPWPVLTQLEQQLTLERVLASDQHRCPALLSLAAAARVEEASAMSDDYQSDRKAFCFWGYLAACGGHDVSIGVQKGHLTITASKRCAQTTDDTTPPLITAPSNREAARCPPSIKNLFTPARLFIPLRSAFHLVVLLLLLLSNATLKMVAYDFLRNISDGNQE